MLTADYIAGLISRSEGHPYVIKILLGEVAKARRLVDIPRLIAGSEEILTALFERTYASLTPCAQRAFMTLAAWNSSIPRLALEAVLMRSIAERQEVERGIESLLQFSMAEMHSSITDKQDFISLPLVASVFGKRKLNISPSKAAIQSDVEILQMLGPSRPDDIHLGLAKRLGKFISNIAKRVESGESFESYSPILEMICRAYNPGWLLMARWHMETGKSIDLAKAKEELNRYLENDPAGADAAEAWLMLGKVCRLTDDTLGEIHAFIERSQINSVPFYDISSTANLLNRSLHTLDLDQEVKRHLAQRLLMVLEKRQKEASADDLSRMAWLALHIGQDSKAQEYAKKGMKMDPDNDHCYKVCERLGIKNS